MKQIRTALLGVGYWGRNLLRNLHSCRRFRVIAICDTSRQALTSITDVPTTSEPDEIFSNPQIDAVVIATPPLTHSALAARALQAGMHVLCEKPLAMTPAACQALGELADQHDRQLMVDCTPVYLDEIQEAGSSIDWAQVHHVRIVRTSAAAIRHPEEVLWDLAPHDLAVLFFWFGRLPEQWEVVTYGESYFELASKFERGPSIRLRVESTQVKQREITVYGKDGIRSFLQLQSTPEPLSVVVSRFADAVLHQRNVPTGVDCALATSRVLTDIVEQVCSPGGQEPIVPLGDQTFV